MQGKKFLCLCMAAFLAVSYPINAHAEDYEGKNDRYVNFTGSRLENNFGTSDLTEEVSNIQPGDTMRLKVAVRNFSGRMADWYMTNEVVQSFEDHSAANGGAYSYRLSYEDREGQETVLYDSSSVGGEGSESTGLHQTENAENEYFYLGRLADGEAGTVYLTVGLDGETVINNYQATLAKLQLNFAVEETAQEGSSGGNGGSGSAGGFGGTQEIRYRLDPEPVPTTGSLVELSGGRVTKTPKTGDTANLLLWSLIALFSGSILLFLGWKRSGEKRSDGEVSK